jgi:hypothetical protein
LPALVLLRKPLSGLAKRQLPGTLCDIAIKMEKQGKNKMYEKVDRNGLDDLIISL